jgi:hypothetical protein
MVSSAKAETSQPSGVTMITKSTDFLQSHTFFCRVTMGPSWQAGESRGITAGPLEVPTGPVECLGRLRPA